MVPERRANCESDSAAVRTWVTLPGEPLCDGVWSVETESMTATDGFRCSRARSTSGRCEVARRLTPWRSAPRRRARAPTWVTDSSAETIRISPSSMASRSRAAICRHSVDFPIPGSPITRVTDPVVTPPPSTRSSSVIPVATVTISATSSSGWSDTGAEDAEDANASSIVFQAPHVGHWPVQRAAGAPHSVQA